MSVTVVDKRGSGSRVSGEEHGDEAALKEREVPPWFPVFVAVEGERLKQIEKWGDQRGKRLDGTGNEFFINWANEYKRQNDERAAKGLPGVWSKIYLEEVFEALSETDPAKIAHELIQATAVSVAWLEDLEHRSQLHV